MHMVPIHEIACGSECISAALGHLNFIFKLVYAIFLTLQEQLSPGGNPELCTRVSVYTCICVHVCV